MSAKVQLIPWDFTSREHTERAYQQRVACGWRSEEVEKWVAMSKAGTKTLYWLVSKAAGVAWHSTVSVAVEQWSRAIR